MNQNEIFDIFVDYFNKKYPGGYNDPDILFNKVKFTRENLIRLMEFSVELQKNVAQIMFENSDYLSGLKYFRNIQAREVFNSYFTTNLIDQSFPKKSYMVLEQLFKEDMIEDFLPHYLKKNDFIFKIPVTIRNNLLKKYNIVDFDSVNLISEIPNPLNNKKTNINLIKWIFKKTSSKEKLIENLMRKAMELEKYPNKKVERAFLSNTKNSRELMDFPFLVLTKNGFLDSVKYLIEQGYKPNKYEIKMFNMFVNRTEKRTKVKDDLMEILITDTKSKVRSFIINNRNNELSKLLNSLDSIEKQEILDDMIESQKNYKYSLIEFNKHTRYDLFKKDDDTPNFLNGIVQTNTVLIKTLIDFGYSPNKKEINLLPFVLKNTDNYNFEKWDFLADIFINQNDWKSNFKNIIETVSMKYYKIDNVINDFYIIRLLEKIMPKDIRSSDKEFIKNILNKNQENFEERLFLNYHLTKKYSDDKNDIENAVNAGLKEFLLLGSNEKEERKINRNILLDVFEYLNNNESNILEKLNINKENLKKLYNENNANYVNVEELDLFYNLCEIKTEKMLMNEIINDNNIKLKTKRL
ncbi:TPA: hypothetical protein NV714_001635 [Escherichia coli]|nr:hypothetical protein [Escherichia coli]